MELERSMIYPSYHSLSITFGSNRLWILISTLYLRMMLLVTIGPCFLRFRMRVTRLARIKDKHHNFWR